MSAAMRLWLTPESQAPRAARRALRRIAGLDQDVRDTAALLVSELVTNAVLHAGLAAHEKIEVTISATTVLRVEVVDPGRGILDRVAAGSANGDGHGLVYVAALARRWGIDGVEHGAVWFELDLPGADGRDGDGDGASRAR
jgi:anti-sigma regulatory factor (Ser/Thr protein kinase)